MPSEFDMAKIIYETNQRASRTLRWLGFLQGQDGDTAPFGDVHRAFRLWCQTVEHCFPKELLEAMHWDYITAESSLRSISALQPTFEKLGP